jgi:hypothetical protein
MEVLNISYTAQHQLDVLAVGLLKLQGHVSWFRRLFHYELRA